MNEDLDFFQMCYEQRGENDNRTFKEWLHEDFINYEENYIGDKEESMNNGV